MSVASSSTSAARAFRTASRPLANGTRCLSGYAPQSGDDVSASDRPPRPESPQFYTGRPQYGAALDQLNRTLDDARATLRKSLIYPLPAGLTPPQPPRTNFLGAPAMSGLLGTKLKAGRHRAVLELLNDLHQTRHLAELAGKGDVVDMIAKVVSRFERGETEESRKEKKKEYTVDELGRAYATGRRKTSAAQVWLVPNPKATGILDAKASNEESLSSPASIPTTEVLVNHLPMAQHFAREADYAAILRPLKLTGLIGAYKVFALVRGGGTTGQAEAVALAIARALTIMRDDVEDVLRSGMSIYAVLSRRTDVSIRWRPPERYAYGGEEEDRSAKSQEKGMPSFPRYTLLSADRCSTPGSSDKVRLQIHNYTSTSSRVQHAYLHLRTRRCIHCCFIALWLFWTAISIVHLSGPLKPSACLATLGHRRSPLRPGRHRPRA